MASPPSAALDPQVIASIVAAVTALVAVAVAPFVTIRASKTQMLGPMRQAWINSLRDTVAEYTAKVDAGIPQSSAVLASDDSLRHAAQRERLEHQQQVYQLKSKIALLINPKESNHVELVRSHRVSLRLLSCRAEFIGLDTRTSGSHSNRTQDRVERRQELTLAQGPR